MKSSKSTLITDDEWKKCHETFQKKAKALMQINKNGQDPDDPECVKRLKGGKSSIVTDDQYKNCHEKNCQLKSQSLASSKKNG